MMRSTKEMRRRLELLRQNAEGRELTLADTDYAKWYMESLGGDEFLKTKFPKVYKAIQRSANKNGPQEDIARKVTANAYRPYMEDNAKQSRDGGSRLISVKGVVGATTTPEIAAIYLTGTLESYDQEIEDERELYDSCYVKFERNKNLGEDEVQAEMSCLDAEVTTFRTESVRTICDTTYICEDAAILPKHDAGPFLLVNGIAENVVKFEAANPRSYFTPPHKVIKVTYKNRINPNADYPQDKDHPEPYSEVEIKDGKVATYLPIDGTILFTDEYTLDTAEASETLVTKLQYKNKTITKYSNGKVKFTKDKENEHLINFSFDQDWKHPIDAELYTVDQPAQLRCSFYCRVVDTKKQPVEIPFIINSSDKPGEYWVEKDTKILIPDISFSWGCFGKDTSIRMADKSERMVSQIRPGDRIAYLNGSGAAVTTVTNVITGSEENMICIEAMNGKKILVTDNHPMRTKRGTVMAAEINITDELIFEDGKAVPIRFLYGEVYRDKVYNLETEDGCCAVIANGFVTGQWEPEDRMQPSKEDRPLSREVKELIAEMDALYRELGLTREV